MLTIDPLTTSRARNQASPQEFSKLVLGPSGLRGRQQGQDHSEHELHRLRRLVFVPARGIDDFRQRHACERDRRGLGEPFQDVRVEHGRLPNLPEDWVFTDGPKGEEGRGDDLLARPLEGSNVLLNLISETEPGLKQHRADELLPIFEVAIHRGSAHPGFERHMRDSGACNPVACHAEGGDLEQTFAGGCPVRGIAIPGRALLAARAFVGGRVRHASMSGGPAYPPGQPVIALPGITRIAERRLCSAIDDSRRRLWSTVAGRRLSAWRTPGFPLILKSLQDVCELAHTRDG